MFRARISLFTLALCLAVTGIHSHSFAASSAEAGTISGTVKDQSGAVIPGATVTLHNPVSGLERTASTDASGNFTFTNIPFNPYHLTATDAGFSPFSRDVSLNSSVPVQLNIVMDLAGGKTTVTVSTEASDLLGRSHQPHGRGSFPD